MPPEVQTAGDGGQCPGMQSITTLNMGLHLVNAAKKKKKVFPIPLLSTPPSQSSFPSSPHNRQLVREKKGEDEKLNIIRKRMPPKKDLKKEPEQPDPKKPEAGKPEAGAPAEKPKEPAGPPVWKKLLATPIFKSFVVTLTKVLIVIAAALAILTLVENLSATKLFDAVSQIRGTLELVNDTYRSQSDVDILIKGRQLADYLNKLNEEGYVGTLLNHQWKVYDKNLYLMTPSSYTHSEGIETCKQMNSVMLIITSGDEELYIEKLIHSKRDHWIGLRKWTTRWLWINDKPLLPNVTFWATGYPQEVNDRCAEMRKFCDGEKKCWYNISCVRLRHTICKMPPDPKMMN